MKKIEIIRHLFTLAAVVGFGAGCASDNYKESATTAVELNQSSGMITKGNRLIDESLADLNDLVSNPYSDLRPQFKRFNNAVDELGESVKDVAGKAGEMKSQGKDYFARWDKESAQIQNEDIRTRSETRRNEVASRFDRISEQYDETRTAFRPFMSDLRDVQKFLSTDLTTDGLAAIKDSAAKATQDAVPVKEALGRLSDEFKSLGLSMSPTTASR
jgi:phage shock protein A